MLSNREGYSCFECTNKFNVNINALRSIDNSCFNKITQDTGTIQCVNIQCFVRMEYTIYKKSNNIIVSIYLYYTYNNI